MPEKITKNMKRTLKDKVIIITGASSGIGEAMARVYASAGACVVLGARSVQKLQLLAGEITLQEYLTQVISGEGKA